MDRYLAPDTLATVYGVLKDMPALPPGIFWIPVEQVTQVVHGDHSASALLAAYFGEELASFLVRHMERLLQLIPGAWEDRPRLFELWTRNVSDRDPQVWLHVDSESSEAGWMQNVKNPIWGTILHLGPAGLQGGETCFCTEHPLPESIARHCMAPGQEPEVRALSQQWVDVPHQPNRLIVFQGSLAHYAAPIDGFPGPDLPRVALLVNLWDHVPAFRVPLTGVGRVSPGEFELFSRLSREEMDAIYLRETYPPEKWAEIVRKLEAKLTGAEIEALLGVLQRLQ